MDIDKSDRLNSDVFRQTRNDITKEDRLDIDSFRITYGEIFKDDALNGDAFRQTQSELSKDETLNTDAFRQTQSDALDMQALTKLPGIADFDAFRTTVLVEMTLADSSNAMGSMMINDMSEIFMY